MIVAIAGMIGYTNYQNNQQDKQAVREVYKIDEDGIYNGLILANTKGDWKKHNTYLYFPNEKQLLDNIPQCVEPTKAQAEEFLKAYKKVYKYILKENLIKSDNPQEIGKYSKQVLDFIYNYQSFEYFRNLYNVPEVGMWFNVSRSIGGTTLAEYEEYYKTDKHDDLLKITGWIPEQIANAVFTQSEQKELAKAEGELLTQVSENCVQAGYGKDFYSIWWSGLANQGVLGATSQVTMMYDIFYKGYVTTDAYYNAGRTDKTRLKGKVWQILDSHKDFINKVMTQKKLSAEDQDNIFNVLTAEILQDDFDNQNYSLPLRVNLVIKLLRVEDFDNKDLLQDVKNTHYFFIEQLSYLMMEHLKTHDDLSFSPKVQDMCGKIRLDKMFWNKQIDISKKLNSSDMLDSYGVFYGCQLNLSKQNMLDIKEVQNLYR